VGGKAYAESPTVRNYSVKTEKSNAIAARADLRAHRASIDFSTDNVDDHELPPDSEIGRRSV